MNKLTSLLNNRFTPYILLGIGIIYVSIEANRMGDFHLFLKAAERMGDKGDIYGTTYIDGFHYYYSPLFASILSCFTHLPYYVPKLIWLLFNLFFVYRIYKIVPEYLNLSSLSANQRTAFWLLSTALVLRFTLINMHVIQMTIFLVYALLEGIHLIDRKKEVKGAMLLALAINIKIMPIVIIPWLLYRKHFKACIYTVLFYLLYLLIPALYIGWQYNMELHASWWKLINPSHKEHLIDVDEAELHSVTTWLPTLLMENARCGADLMLKRNIANLPVETVVCIIQGVRIVLLALVFYFLRSLPFRNVQSHLQQWWELSYIFLITPLIFPHQQFYAFLFMLPAFFYLAYFFVFRGNKDKILLVGLCIVFILTSFIGGTLGFLRDISSHYKLITYGSLITVGLLAYYRPSFIEGYQYTLNKAE